MNNDSQTLGKARFLILDKQGNETRLDGNRLDRIEVDFDPALAKVILANLGQIKSVHFAHHTELLRRLEWVDREPASDAGNYRYYPKGAMIYNLLRIWMEETALEVFGALPINTPLLYRRDFPGVAEQTAIFQDRLYTVSKTAGEGQGEFVLRFGDDVGLFSIMSDAQLTYRHLPFRTYEHAQCFRYNLTGELSGIRRARAFSFTDIHSFCADLDQGIAEYQEAHRLMEKMANVFGLKLILHFKVSEEFYPQIKPHLLEMIDGQTSLALVEVLPNLRQYWSLKHVTYSDHPQKVFHVQLDLINAKRYGVYYTASDGDQKDCVIVHSSLGSTEKWLLIAVENALRQNPPSLPLWLAPVQIRLIPIGDHHLSACLQLAETFRSHRIRIDIDDRPALVGKRIQAAEREWIPYIIVFGNREIAAESLPVRVRGGTLVSFTAEQLITSIVENTTTKPFRPLPYTLVSRRPVFLAMGEEKGG